MVLTKAGTDGSQQCPEIPELPLRRRVESIPYQGRNRCPIQVVHHRAQVVKEVCSLDKDGAVRHLGHMVDLFLLSLVPGLAFIPAHSLILGDLKDQAQHPCADGLFNRSPPIGIWNVFNIIMEQSGCQYFVTGAETREDTYDANKVADVGDAILVQEIPPGLTRRSLKIPLTKLVKMTPSRQAARALEHGREQGAIRLNGEVVLSHQNIVSNPGLYSLTTEILLKMARKLLAICC